MIPEDDHCVMYDKCEGEKREAPCIYNGTAKPLDKSVGNYGDPVELLKQICPDFAKGKLFIKIYVDF